MFLSPIDSCEVRPGPQFITRYIKTLANSTWEGFFHRYNDSLCSQPKSSLFIRGSYRVQQESLDTIRGSNKAMFNFTTIRLYPQSSQEERAILTLATKSCPNMLRVVDTVGGKAVFDVNHRAFGKRSCRSAFGISESELSALKLETRRKKSSKYDKLYFGEIPTIRVKRKYNPKCYQLPLQRHTAPNCTVCSKIRAGTGERPPRLSETRHRMTLRGEWASTTCETRPGGSFLTRHFNFTANTWECRFFYFLDPECKKLDFELNGKGIYIQSDASHLVPNAYEFVFTMNRASLTPYDSTTTEVLNSEKHNMCGIGKWETNVPKDLTPTDGCSTYRISIPHTEYDLLKIGTDNRGNKLLYVGQRATDSMVPSAPLRRPTSFQIPLVQCSAFRFKFVPPTTRPTTRPTSRFPKRPEIPIGTIPTFRPKETTTRKRTDSETARDTTGKKTVNNDDNTHRLSAYANSGTTFSAAYTLTTVTSLLILVVPQR